MWWWVGLGSILAFGAAGLTIHVMLWFPRGRNALDRMLDRIGL